MRRWCQLSSSSIGGRRRCGGDQRRFVRIGTFRSDADFIDPETVLFSESVDEWRCSDDGYMRQPVLERSNVGMATLILNNKLSNGFLNLHGINRLYRKLRNLEVNSLIKSVALTSSSRDTFCKGLPLKDLLLYAEASQRVGQLQPLALQVLRNQSELTWLIHSFYKPLLVLLNGEAVDSGSSVCLASARRAAYAHSSFSADAAAIGWIPTAGLSHILSRLRGSLGIYLALTGHSLAGPDLVWAGLCKHWVSPESLKHLELTSEKQLEVSEADAALLIEEHYLKAPETYSLQDWEETIEETFNRPTLAAVLAFLRRRTFHGSSSFRARRQEWAEDTYNRIANKSPLAAQLTFTLLRDLKSYRQSVLESAGIDATEWNFLRGADNFTARNPHQSSIRQVVDAVDEKCLMKALRLETRAASRLLMSADVVEGVGSALLSGAPQWRNPNWCHKSVEAVGDQEIESYFAPLSHNRSAEFTVRERADIALSAFPSIRKLHPDYSHTTGLDHDPTFMQSEVKRWADDYLQEEHQILRDQLLN
eukprot:GHVS01042255.1.p1 GENE.GHVS01042255.1~~GHVS01042255.1.p1  ORF type:complete len:535 (+),score=75.26 GHVS01042255.1:162-1766(+)